MQMSEMPKEVRKSSWYNSYVHRFKEGDTKTTYIRKGRVYLIDLPGICLITFYWSINSLYVVDCLIDTLSTCILL